MGKTLDFLRLTRNRKRSEDDYFEFQRFQAKLMIDELKKHVSINADTKMLDVGSGLGGYLEELARLPCKKVISLDKNPYDYTINRFKGSEKVQIIKGDITKTDFKDNSFDLVIASNVIEHVEDQKAMIKECRRILKDRGILYISFPPYYSPKGGHAISPFHYLPGKLPLLMYQSYHRAKNKEFRCCGLGLVKTTISSMIKLVREDFEVLRIKARVFDLLNPIVKVPLIREVLIHNVEFILKKR